MASRRPKEVGSDTASGVSCAASACGRPPLWGVFPRIDSQRVSEAGACSFRSCRGLVSEQRERARPREPQSCERSEQEASPGGPGVQIPSLASPTRRSPRRGKMHEGIWARKVAAGERSEPDRLSVVKSFPSHGEPTTEESRLGYRERRLVRRERMRKTASLGRLPSQRLPGINDERRRRRRTGVAFRAAPGPSV